MHHFFHDHHALITILITFHSLHQLEFLTICFILGFEIVKMFKNYCEIYHVPFLLH